MLICKAQSIKPRLNALYRNSPPFHPAAWVHGPAFKSQSFRCLHSQPDVRYCSIKGFFGTAVPEVFGEERDYPSDTSTGSGAEGMQRTGEKICVPFLPFISSSSVVLQLSVEPWWQKQRQTKNIQDKQNMRHEGKVMNSIRLWSLK